MQWRTAGLWIRDDHYDRFSDLSHKAQMRHSAPYTEPHIRTTQKTESEDHAFLPATILAKPCPFYFSTVCECSDDDVLYQHNSGGLENAQTLSPDTATERGCFSPRTDKQTSRHNLQLPLHHGTAQPARDTCCRPLPQGLRHVPMGHDHSFGRNHLRKRLLVTTKMDENAIAMPAYMGGRKYG